MSNSRSNATQAVDGSCPMPTPNPSPNPPGGIAAPTPPSQRCDVCYEDLALEEFLRPSLCQHTSNICKVCLGDWFTEKICRMEYREPLKCFINRCTHDINLVYSLMDDAVVQSYFNKPFLPRFAPHLLGPEHGETSTAFLLVPSEVVEEHLTAIYLAGHTTQCPHCGAFVSKIDGCDHIMCRCEEEFCYRCGGRWYESPDSDLPGCEHGELDDDYSDEDELEEEFEAGEVTAAEIVEQNRLTRRHQSVEVRGETRN